MLRAAVLVVLLAASHHALAGAWTLDRGKLKAFLVSTFTYGDHGFDSDGKLVTVPEYKKFELTAAAEYGLRPWLTGLVKAEFREETLMRYLSPTVLAPTSQSFGSGALGARIRLHKAPAWVFSTEVTALSGGFETAGDPEPDSAAVEVRALFGTEREIAGRRIYADVQAGLRKNFDADASDEIKVDVTVGAQLLPRWLILAQTFSTFELAGDVQYHKVSGSVVHRLSDRLQVEVSALTTLYGRDALREIGGRVGFWYAY
ncbi:hypothetical protein [Acuticoccus mangrovi]|uniref:Transporter n=1 Tax=Acuticoccus mangrovi TaxID=2796142 RepID=A0A934IJV5_9HYPH|nr:hypothetical protein [Acuticoccus mangrovi]MBJ3777828.1 hypothetical protein [Acuticoccus mangrovi]